MAVPLPLLLPGTGAELVFCFGAPFAIREGERTELLRGNAFLFCLRSRACQLVATGPVGFISVRLRGEALRHFADAPLMEWIDGFASVEEAMGKGWADFPERLANAPGFTARAKLLEARLERHLALRETGPSIIDRAVVKCYYNAGSTRVSEIAANLNMSARHFERMFRDATGLTPKRFQRVARFHHTMRKLLLDGQTNYLGTALENGFYDQAHFIHECQDLSGYAPREILTADSFLSHFYNQSLPR